MENRDQKPWYKKWWLIVLLVVGAFIVLAIIFPQPEETDTDKDKETTTEETTNTNEEEKEEPTPERNYTVMSVWHTAPKLDTLHYALLSDDDSKSNVAIILKEIGKNECNNEFCKIILWGSENDFRTADDLNDYKNTFSILNVSGPPAGLWDDDSDYYLYYDESFEFD